MVVIKVHGMRTLIVRLGKAAIGEMWRKFAPETIERKHGLPELLVSKLNIRICCERRSTWNGFVETVYHLSPGRKGGESH